MPDRKWKLLTMRIYSRSEDYDAMRELHNKYGDNESVYVIYNPDIEEEYIYRDDERLLEIKGEETYIPGILVKTIKAIEICLKLFQFDLLLRSNMSTIINVDLLHDKLNVLNNVNNFYGGNRLILNKLYHIKYGVDAHKLEILRGLEYASGTSIILSNDVCTKLVSEKSTVDYTIIDDLAIAKFMKDNYIMLYNIQIVFPTADLTVINDESGLVEKLKEYAFVRCKFGGYDLTNMKYIYEVRKKYMIK